MLELTPQDHALLRHLKREEERCLQAYLRTGTKHPNVQQNLWRARKELEKFLRNLHIQGKPM
jgi:hypothetical protein